MKTEMLDILVTPTNVIRLLKGDDPHLITIWEQGVRLIGETPQLFRDKYVVFERKGGKWLVKASDKVGFPITLKGNNPTIWNRSLGILLMRELKLKKSTRAQLNSTDSAGIYEIELL